jgi:hypothetical protein
MSSSNRRNWSRSGLPRTNSAKDDPLRSCELKFTHGLIALEAGQFETAVRYLEQSTDFHVSSPCVMALHLDFLAQALARNRQLEQSLKVTALNVPIAAVRHEAKETARCWTAT